jgi:hypothetical protein
VFLLNVCMCMRALACTCMRPSDKINKLIKLNFKIDLDSYGFDSKIYLKN